MPAARRLPERHGPRWILIGLLLALIGAKASGQCLPDPVEQWLPTPSAASLDFGISVSISGDWAVVGSELDDSLGKTDAGAIYIYHLTPTGWTVPTKHFAPDAVSNDHFGIDVAIDGDTIVVGSRQHNHGQGVNSGAAYVFERNGLSWSYSVELHGSGVMGDGTEYGSSVDIFGDVIAVGSMFEDVTCSGSGPNLGTAYVYVRPQAGWSSATSPLTESATLCPAMLASGARFGQDVAIDGSMIVVGAPLDTFMAVISPGAAYVFTEPIGGWSGAVAEVAKIGATIPSGGGEFGIRVDVEQNNVAGYRDTVVIGARSHPGTSGPRGAAFVKVEPAGGWSSTTNSDVMLLSSQTTDADMFGVGVAIDGDRIVVGAAGDDPPGKTDFGRAFVFQRLTGNWSLSSETHWLESLADPFEGGISPAFGHAVAIDGGTLIIGAPFDDDGANVDAGAAYTFEIVPCHIELYCFCPSGPCMNSQGSSGCKNSTGAGTLLTGKGSTSVGSDELFLTATGVPPNQFGIIFMGGAATTPMPFGDGLLCVGSGGMGTYRYLPPKNSGSLGQIVEGPIVSLSQIFPQPGKVDVGEQWFFQCWYRDPPGPCGSGFNLSNALAVTFVP
jgi:hypothetical protein